MVINWKLDDSYSRKSNYSTVPYKTDHFCNKIIQKWVFWDNFILNLGFKKIKFTNKHSYIHSASRKSTNTKTSIQFPPVPYYVIYPNFLSQWESSFLVPNLYVTAWRSSCIVIKSNSSYNSGINIFILKILIFYFDYWCSLLQSLTYCSKVLLQNSSFPKFHNFLQFFSNLSLGHNFSYAFFLILILRILIPDYSIFDGKSNDKID